MEKWQCLNSLEPHYKKIGISIDMKLNSVLFSDFILDLRPDQPRKLQNKKQEHWILKKFKTH